MDSSSEHKISRRDFLKWSQGGFLFFTLLGWPRSLKSAPSFVNDVYWVKRIPEQPFYLGDNTNYHAGVDGLLSLMGRKGLKFYRSTNETIMSGPDGMISADDIVLIKVNAQWKYRGCTNSDVICGLIQKILDHPDIFTGEIVIFENGQGRGSLNCDTYLPYQNDEVHANANDESHSFLYLVNNIFNDPRVSSFLLDPIRGSFIGEDDHVSDGYRIYENVSYPCFTSTGGNRIEFMEGIWNGNGYSQNIKLINVPILKHHDIGGSEITASLKHVYGIVSMSDGQSGFRHYQGLGETCGKMMVSVRTPVLNIIDAIWISQSSLRGHPESTTYRTDQLMASQDPVALDYVSAKYILNPIDNNDRHHPEFPGIDVWLQDARDIINARGGLLDANKGIFVNQVTKNEEEMQIFSQNVTPDLKADLIGSWDGQGLYYRNSDTGDWVKLASPADSTAAGDLDGDGNDDLLGNWYSQGGIWIKSSSTGSWTKISSPASDISTGDMNGDGRVDLLGNWDSQGVFYRDSITKNWVMMASPAYQVVAGDINGDGTDDLIGIWPAQGGVWVKYSSDSSWERLSPLADYITTGDMNGNGKVDLVGTWNGQGVFYLDSLAGIWEKIATPALKIATGDLDGDGVDDLIGIWPAQGGIWVKYSSDGSWERLASTANCLTTGKMRAPTSSFMASNEILSTSYGPSGINNFNDLSNEGPGGINFVCLEQKNLIPLEGNSDRINRLSGPGEPGFRYKKQRNLVPKGKFLKQKRY